MQILKQISYFSILAASLPMPLLCFSDKIKNTFVGAACAICPAIAEGQQAIGKTKELHAHNQTLQNHNQMIQSSLESATKSQAIQAAMINNLINDLAATHNAKQEADAAAALMIQTEKDMRLEMARQLSHKEAIVVALGASLAIGITAAIGYGVYYGVSRYLRNKSKAAAQQQLRACTEGDPTLWGKNQNCKKQFQEFARHAQGEELLWEQDRFRSRMHTS
jgi:hypothetical protein